MFNKNCDKCEWNDGLDCRDMDWDEICPGWKPNKKAEAQLVEAVKAGDQGEGED